MQTIKLTAFPHETESIIGLLQAHAANSPELLACRFFEDGETETAVVTFDKLWQRARAIAAKLQLILEPGERALLLYPSGVDFIEAFLGCLAAKVIAVPAYPPNANRHTGRITSIIDNCDAKVVLTTTKTLQLIKMKNQSLDGFGKCRWLETNTIANDMADEYQAPRLNRVDVAFLQYTSGSTGNPKGVMVSHGNILANIAMFRTGMGFKKDSVMASWLPVFHDMGLIGCILGPLAIGFPVLLMPPVSFLEKPVRWLKLISQFRATVSGAPNFAFELVTRKVTEQQLAELNLSSLSVLFNGAEPVRAESLQKFTEKFSSAGFDARALFPCYGMAESTLIISGGPLQSGAQSIGVSAEKLEANIVEIADTALVNAKRVVGCGVGYSNQNIKIVSPETKAELPATSVGEIWVSGDHISKGYWANEAVTQETFGLQLESKLSSAPYLRTGDLGFMLEGQLYITGRLKDMIIVNGANFYPQDIEASVETNPALRAGGCIAYGDDQSGKDELVVVAELERHSLTADLTELASTIAAKIFQDHETAVSRIYFIKTGHALKTSSGKVQRRATRDAIRNSALEVLYSWTSHGEVATPVILRDEPVLAPRVVTPTPVKTVPPVPKLKIARSVVAEKTADSMATSAVLTTLETWFLTQPDMNIKSMDFDAPLSRYGVDSVAIIALQSFIEEQFKTKIPQDFFFDNPSLRALAEQVCQTTAA